MRGAGLLGVALGPLWAGASACDGNYDHPADRRWTSAHFDYLARASDDAISPAVLGPLENHFAELQGYLGFDWPDGQKVTYETFADSVDFTAHQSCGREAEGCAITWWNYARTTFLVRAVPRLAWPRRRVRGLGGRPKNMRTDNNARSAQLDGFESPWI